MTDEEKREKKLVLDVCILKFKHAVSEASKNLQEEKYKENIRYYISEVSEEHENIVARLEYNMELLEDVSFVEKFAKYEQSYNLAEARAALDTWIREYRELM